MPFIEQKRRDLIDIHGIAVLTDPQPGDLCYSYYKPMVDAWKKNPRWTTAHEIFRKMMLEYNTFSFDDAAAYSLAWQVFFNLHVIPYELEKRKSNGDIS